MKLLPIGLLFLLAGLAKAFHGLARDRTFDSGLQIILISLLLGLFFVAAAALINRLRH